ncbi:TIGR00645 family protein [Streptomyces sp. NPDC090022]|uniref:TIGR00645 family protein n=1 Tax=Streptomyces sp. NPDC090022 TaxID=3365920 RepID=UPI00381C9F3F
MPLAPPTRPEPPTRPAPSAAPAAAPAPAPVASGSAAAAAAAAATPGNRIGRLMFLSRWLQLPLYVGLIVAQMVYVWVFLKELTHLVGAFDDLDETRTMLVVLGLVDVVMVANLLLMVIVGGYETFVARVGLKGHPDEPEWLSHVNANVLKVKLATAIIGISSIHLLKSFIEISREGWQWQQTMWQVIVHLAFIVSALSLAAIDRLLPKAHEPAMIHRTDP